MTKHLNLNQCLFVGIDAHKEFHLALACNRFEEQLGVWRVANNLQGIKRFVKQTEVLAHHEKSLTTIFGIENSRGNGEKLTQYLLNNNSIVYEVNPVRTHQRRSKTIFRDKSDVKDAEKIAAELTRKIAELPLLTKQSEDTLFTVINEWSLFRDELVKGQTAIKNQLHNLFHKDNPDYKEKFKTVFSQKALRYWQGRAQRQEKKQDVLLSGRASMVKAKIKRFKQLSQAIDKIEAKLEPLIAQTGQQLETMPGVDGVAAAKVIGETRHISRFRSPDKYVRYAGIAPRESSSGTKIKFKKSKAGNRRLNQTIYFIALAQIRTLPRVKQFYRKKVSQGKTKRTAITYVMRRIAVILYGMLRTKGVYVAKDN